MSNTPDTAQSLTPLVTDLQNFASNLHSDVEKSWGVLYALGTGNPQQFSRLSYWQPALLNLFITIICTYLAYVVLRRLARLVFNRLNSWAERQPSDEQITLLKKSREKLSHSKARHRQIRKLGAVFVAFIVDALTFILATFVGYLVILALPALIETPRASVLSMQFLTAFFAVELGKTLSRAIFAPHYNTLRLLPISQSSATYWNSWMSTLITVGGYGLLILVPVLQTVLSHALANVVGALLILAVYIYAIRVLWRNRHEVSSTCIELADHAENAVMGTTLRFVAKIWIWAALLYATALFIITQADQQNALSFMAKASAQSLVALGVGGVASLILSSFVTKRLHFSEQLNESFPLLEERLNSYIPAIFRVLRLLVLAAVLLSLFDAWHLLNLKEWVSTGNGMVVIHTILRVVMVFILAALAWTVLASIIENRLSGSGQERTTEREKTLLMLFRNALAIVIITLSTLIVLSEIGIDIGPLIAGAGVVGLAVGFGAQKLVQDVITGVFIQLENGMNQNDIVEVAGLFGTVEKLTIRSVVIRTLDGGYHLVPFSSIDCVTNHTRDYGYHVGEYLISLDQSVDYAIEHLKAAFEELKKDEEVADSILEEMTVPGVTALGREGAKIRILIKTAPGMQWAVQRHFNRLVKQHFDAAGIEIPYPQTVLHFGKDKETVSNLLAQQKSHE